MSNVLVVGFDAATWRVIDPLIAAGRMPHLARLKAAGSSGVIRSVDYSASPVVWTTIATGKTPALHGIRDFYSRQDQLRAKRIWEIVAEQGGTVGVFQWLVTWPPQPLSGFVVPGWLAPEPTTHPRELEFYTRFKTESQRGRVRTSDLFRFASRFSRNGLTSRTALRAAGFVTRRLARRDGPRDKYRAQLLDMSLSTDLFRDLIRRHRPEFAAIVFYQADSAGHTYWKYREPQRFADVTPEAAERYGGVIDTVYARLDEALGTLLRGIDSTWTVAVISDHGMGPVQNESGWPYRPRLAALLDRWGILPEGTHSYIGADFYVRLMGSTPLAREYQRARLESLLEGIRLVREDAPLFESAPTDDGYVKIRLRQAHPALRDEIVRLPNGSECRYEDVVWMDSKFSGQHEPEGILVLAGPGVRPGRWLGPVELTDVTPTLLALLGRPVGLDMQGSVLTDALTPDFLARHPLRYIETYESRQGAATFGLPYTKDQASEVEARLRALGYLA